MLVVLIVLFILFAIITIGIIIYGVENDRISAIPELGEVGLLSSCVEKDCPSGFICDGNTFTCKLEPGQPCVSAAECGPGTICSGVCASGPVGGLNELCPCDEGYSCFASEGMKSICLGDAGQSCSIGGECFSQVCDKGICSSGHPNAYPCTQATDCASEHCSQGFCQDPDRTTGEQGAACAGNCVSYEGATCNSTSSDPLGCECQNEGPGICTQANNGITDNCGRSSICAGSLLCYDHNDVCDTDDDVDCICVFPPILEKCVEGMSLKNGICRNDLEYGCDSQDQCVSDICGGESSLTIYHFDKDGVNQFTKFTGATETRLFKENGPSGLIKPHKMLTRPEDNDVDEIYVIDQLQGVLTSKYNTKHRTITDWDTLIPHTVEINVGFTSTTVDFTYNPDGGEYVAFEETDGVDTFSTIYEYQGSGTYTPFNPTVGSGFTGTQYTNGTPLKIDFISISRSNDISAGNDMMITSNGIVYIKLAADTNYNVAFVYGGPMNGLPINATFGPSTFYDDDEQILSSIPLPPVCPEQGGENPIQCPSSRNVAFVGRFDNTVQYGGAYTLPQTLQFGGNTAAVTLPVDPTLELDYRVFDFNIYSDNAMQESSIATLSEVYKNDVKLYNTVSLSSNGNTTQFPFQIGTTARCAAGKHAFYVLSLGSCTN